MELIIILVSVAILILILIPVILFLQSQINTYKELINNLQNHIQELRELL